jgi:site-specific recombinase XerD
MMGRQARSESLFYYFRLEDQSPEDLWFLKTFRAKATPKELVLYCARHDYGTRVLMRTGNLAAVMRTMGHRDVKTAMHYQHPELEIVRSALDYRPPTPEAAV